MGWDGWEGEFPKTLRIHPQIPALRQIFALNCVSFPPVKSIHPHPTPSPKPRAWIKYCDRLRRCQEFFISVVCPFLLPSFRNLALKSLPNFYHAAKLSTFVFPYYIVAVCLSAYRPYLSVFLSGLPSYHICLFLFAFCLSVFCLSN